MFHSKSYGIAKKLLCKIYNNVRKLFIKESFRTLTVFKRNLVNATKDNLIPVRFKLFNVRTEILERLILQRDIFPLLLLKSTKSYWRTLNGEFKN